MTLGVHAAILGAVKVGHDTVVSYRTQLTTDAPPHSVAASRNSRVSIDADGSP